MIAFLQKPTGQTGGRFEGCEQVSIRQWTPGRRTLRNAPQLVAQIRPGMKPVEPCETVRS